MHFYTMDISWIDELISQIKQQDFLSIIGLVSGLLCVYYLIKQHIITWAWGILYCLVSFVIFWRYQLYGDFILHVVFLVLNIYGWLSWSRGDRRTDSELKVSNLSAYANMGFIMLSGISIYIFAQVLISVPNLFSSMEDASVPYWDSTTTVLSVLAIWMQTKKYIESWYYWLVVDILATGIYAYKGIYFYSLLYFIYIFLAIAGYLAWRTSQKR